MMEMYEELFEFGKKRAKFTAWVFSDVHSASMEESRHLFDVVMNDYEKIGKPADMIWYLGDAVWTSREYDSGNILDRAAHQLEIFENLGLSLCYVTGNHDYDYAHIHYGESRIELPFSSEVRHHKGWYTTASVEDTWFRVKIRNTMVYFFSDHMAPDASWISNHNQVNAGRHFYPYGPSHFAAIRHDMETCGAEHIITASHYAFPGGNLQTNLLSMIQPLPRTVNLHLYGHCHIGKYSGEERTFSQIQWVNWQDIPQVDIASLNGVDGDNFRSAFLQMYEDDSLGLFFRNHSTGRFYSAFFPSNHSAEPEGGYEKHAEKINPASILPDDCPGMIRDGFGPAAT